MTYWTDGRSARIFAAADHYLYALDADTGKPIESFGRAGRIESNASRTAWLIGR